MATNGRKQKSKSFDRITFLAIALFILGAALILQLFRIQVLHHKIYTVKASEQRGIKRGIEPKRGEIFFQDKFQDKLYPLATNKTVYTVYAVPKEIEDPEGISQKIATLLGLNVEDLLLKLSKKDDPYEPIKERVEEKDLAELKKLDIKGLGFSPQDIRFYPENNLASHIIGFVGFDHKERKGQYGLEEYFDKELSGVPGELITEKDIKGRPIGIGQRDIKPPQNGINIVLTIDRTAEFFTCDTLKKYIEKYAAEGGSVIIMNPRTGDIVAMCSYPDFDPNAYNKVKGARLFVNPVISDQYEPGSVFKPITMAGALDQNVVTPHTTYNDIGAVKIGKYTIRNSDLKAHGVRTMIDVLDESLNTGAIFVARQLGAENFKDYVKKFGLGEITDITLTGEVAGDVTSLDQKGEIYSATASFGQGITVTPLELITAFSAIANDGELVKPNLIKEIIYSDGRKEESEPKIIRRVISKSAANTLTAMLISAVEKGYSKKAGISDYYVAGKTGTAQIPKKGGYSDETIHNFLGFVPALSPRFVILTKLDKVKNVRWAASSTAPMFHDVAKFLLDYYEIPPDIGNRQ